MSEIDYSKIELLVLDVDGVLTDGKIIITPDGDEIKEFHVRDGAGMKYWRRVGKKIAIITGRGSKAVEHRCKDLDVDMFKINVKDKYPVYQEMLAAMKLKPEQVAVVADDLPELPMMKNCAFPVAVADAVSEIKQSALYVTYLNGGNGAVREAIEHILKRSGAWENVLSRYEGKTKGKGR